jgi:hypothetical protein
MLTYDDVSVGDQLWCVAWIGKEFTVVEKDDESHRVALEGANAVDPYGAQVDLFPDTMWMATREPWDQIWFWPDRAGERFDEVFDRWWAAHEIGQVVLAYPLDQGLASLGFVKVRPRLAMAFRIVAIDVDAHIQVEPVVIEADPTRRGDEALAAPPEAWVAVGPRAPARIRMADYRWALSFGDLILNWEDFLDPRETLVSA